MFKVSLLPASYRKLLDGKKKKDIILKIAVVGLLCMLVIYFGLYARTLLLESQIKDIGRQNRAITAEIDELQQYKYIYDELVLSQGRLDAIKSKNPSTVKFLTLIQNNRPEYIKINAISLNDWQNNPVCVIEGELSAAQKIGDAVDHLRAYEEFLKTDKAFEGMITEIKVLNDMPIIDSENGEETYSFRIFISLGGSILMDDSGNLITTESTTASTTETTTAATTTTATTKAAE